MWWDSQNVRDAARIDLLSERGLSRDQEALFIGWNFSRFSAMFYATGNPRVLKIVRPWHPHTRALSGAVGESTVFEGKWTASEGFQLILVVQYMRCAVCCALRYALHTYTYALRDNNVHVRTHLARRLVISIQNERTSTPVCVRTCLARAGCCFPFTLNGGPATVYAYVNSTRENTRTLCACIFVRSVCVRIIDWNIFIWEYWTHGVHRPVSFTVQVEWTVKRNRLGLSYRAYSLNTLCFGDAQARNTKVFPYSVTKVTVHAHAYARRTYMRILASKASRIGHR